MCGSGCICSIVHFLASQGHCKSPLQRRCYCQRVSLRHIPNEVSSVIFNMILQKKKKCGSLPYPLLGGKGKFH